MNNIRNLLGSITLLSASFIASAGTTTWEWDMRVGTAGHSVTTCNNECPTSGFTVTDTVNGDSVTAGFNGFADTAGGGNDTGIESGDLRYYDNDSWGIQNQDEGSNEHAFDNRNGDYDMVLVSFDTSIELTDINFGYVSDGDFSLLAYTGSGTPSSLVGNTWANVNASSDWLTIGNYAGSGTGYYSVNENNVSSQYWLIGAYNTVFGPEGNGVYDGNDKFKLKAIKGISTDIAQEVPAPASFAFLMIGALFAIAKRRKTIKTLA
jgi:hypothetical protein